MNTLIPSFRGAYRLLVRGADLLRSPLLLALRVYFFWQLFMTGQGKLMHLAKVTEFFTSLGIPFPAFNAVLVGTTEMVGGLLLIIGLASRLAAIPVFISMAVAYLTADLEAVTNLFSDPDKFVKADPFPYFLCALIVLAFGPGKLSVDAWLKRKFGTDEELPAIRRPTGLGSPAKAGADARK